MKRMAFVLALLAPGVDSGPVYIDASQAVWRVNREAGTMELCAPAAGGDQAVFLAAPVIAPPPRECGKET